MKNTNVKRKNQAAKSIAEAHTNRLLVSVTVALSYLIILMLIHRGQTYTQTILQAVNASVGVCIVSGIVAVAIAVAAFLKKKVYLSEYIALFAVMSFCFYCIHGVRFINTTHIKYITAIALVAYLIGTFVYHSIVPKMIKK